MDTKLCCIEAKKASEKYTERLSWRVFVAAKEMRGDQTRNKKNTKIKGKDLEEESPSFCPMAP